MPEFEGRELIDQKICWCTDTADAEWLFCEDPRWCVPYRNLIDSWRAEFLNDDLFIITGRKNLFLATGDSGHSFHTIPFVGSEIADMLEGKVSELSVATSVGFDRQMLMINRSLRCPRRNNRHGAGDRVVEIRSILEEGGLYPKICQREMVGCTTILRMKCRDIESNKALYVGVV